MTVGPSATASFPAVRADRGKSLRPMVPDRGKSLRPMVPDRGKSLRPMVPDRGSRCARWRPAGDDQE
ncbi:hypothetical protein [Kitasatospora sp. NBC_01539]|uniref:hypothetical protein n=1 Tax=Kitasatospora sp. NBC_01539 TaxID=2903577 RepID=UPI00386015BC